MSRALPHSQHFLLSRALLYLFFYPKASEGKDGRHLAMNASSLFPAKTCASASGVTHNNSFKIFHKQGLCSPFVAAAKSKPNKPSFNETLVQDRRRLSFLRRINHDTSGGVKPQASQENIELWSGGSLDYFGGYLVTVGLGTPKVEQSLILDTGSDLCWAQCRPCAVSCHYQKDKIFDPYASTSYRRIGCETAECRSLDSYSCGNGGKVCVYDQRYVDGSLTIGYLSRDKLTLGETDVIPNFVFGCGQDNTGLLGKAAGLLGLNRGSNSFVSQTYGQYGGVFSYCLPLLWSSTGHLKFGPAALSDTPISYTPMLTDNRYSSYYFLQLTGISVGGNMLPISPETFSSTGTMLDSGTTLSYIPSSVYEELRMAVQSGMSGYSQRLVDKDLSCYDFTGMEHVTVRVPTVTLHFDGGTVIRLTGRGIFYADDIKMVCLAFGRKKGENDLNVIGSVQQQPLVVYDLRNKRIGFGPRNCAQ